MFSRNKKKLLVCISFLIILLGIFMFYLTNKDKGYLMEWQQSSISDFHEAKYRNHIVSATFVETKEVPVDAIAEWDVSINKDKSVVAYIVSDEIDKSLYHLYIGAKGKVIAPKSLSHIFHNFPLLEKVDMSSLDARNVEMMWRSFSSNPSLKRVLLPSNTENLENINAIFSGCTSLESLNLSNMNLDKVRDIGYAFSGCAKLKDVDFGDFMAQSVEVASYAFSGCNSLISLDINKFNPESLKEVSHMFNWANNLKILNISGIDFDEVNGNVDAIFYQLPLDAIVYVKDEKTKQWILSLPYTNRPMWTDSNIIVR